MERPKYVEDVVAAKLSGEPLTIFLTNGVKLTGAITGSYENGFKLTRDGLSQIVLYPAVATIAPNREGWDHD